MGLFPCLPPENAPAFALYAVSLTRSVAKTERSGDASPKPKHKKNTPKKTRAELPKNSLKPGQTSPGWKRYVQKGTFRGQATTGDNSPEAWWVFCWELSFSNLLSRVKVRMFHHTLISWFFLGVGAYWEEYFPTELHSWGWSNSPSLMTDLRNTHLESYRAIFTKLSQRSRRPSPVRSW